MQEATRLQALWSWIRGSTGGRSLAAAVLATAIALAALWMTRDGPIGVAETVANPDSDTGPGQPPTSVNVQGDGVAAGRDLKIEGGVNFR